MRDILSAYLSEVLSSRFNVKLLPGQETFSLPLYIRSAFDLYSIHIFNKNLVLAHVKDDEAPAGQLIQQINIISQVVNKQVALVVNSLDTNKRRKLIIDKVDFIVPGKQLFLPSLFVILKDGYSPKQVRKEKIIPRA